jgi:hypothetical protein
MLVLLSKVLKMDDGITPENFCFPTIPRRLWQVCEEKKNSTGTEPAVPVTGS